MKFTRLAAVAALVMSAGFANAAILPDFTVTPGTFATGKSAFVADKITGNYVERVTFNGNGTFDVSILWNAGNFVKNDGSSAIFGPITGLNNTGGYGMYAFFQGSGTFASGNFALGSGSLQLYLDKSLDTTFNDPSVQSSTAFWGVTSGGGADDPLLASGSAVTGNGFVSCTGNNVCGAFGQTTTFNLTPTGSSFFTAPNPFYMLSLQSGQFNGFTPAGTVTLDGSLDVIFANVPEPGSIALVGLALVGLGFASRRKAK